ncbi:MAG: FG-GAP-like repeat-containing protein [Candidatus Marinimicrobia bacterium]|nr:FG-GAP-like repeat-containing protein [Candidatus Neomarinimicrobiota bacterium]
MLFIIILPIISFSQEFWSPTGSIPAASNVFRLAVDAQNRVFACVDGAGLFVSTDEGTNWVFNEFNGYNLRDVLVTPSNDVFVAAGNQVFRSNDQGNTWTDVSSGLPGADVYSLGTDSEGRLFAGLYGAMIYRSQDNGNTWQALTRGLSDQTVYVSMAINSQGHIIAGTNGAHIYRSIDHGENWQRLTTGLSSAEVWALEIDTEDRIFAGTGNGVCISNDNGTSWSLAPQTEGAVDVNDMTINSTGHIFASNNNGGVWRTNDHGNSWENIGNPAANGATPWGLAMDNQDYLYAGAGNGQVFRSTLATVENTSSFFPINAGIQPVNRSSVEWGDYDGDGYLDLLMVGTDVTQNYAKIYRNDGSHAFVELTSAGLQGVINGPVTWGDYDNDGDLDILLTGYDGSSTNFSIVYRNDGGGSFTDLGLDLVPVGSGSVDWGDYDNDGDLDIFMTGWNGTTSYALVYRNDDGSFVDIDAGLPGVRSGSSPWVDYDNDGDLDIFLSGWNGTESFTQIFENDNGIFHDIEAGLTTINGSAAWGDYDNDGDLDLLLTGFHSGAPTSTALYRNDNSVFVEVSSGLPGVGQSSVAWGDYDNDGDLDILLNGWDGTQTHTDIFQNNAGTFTAIHAGLPLVKTGVLAWGDYDNDGDLDVFLTGQDTDLNYYSEVYRNDGETANTPPQAPANLSSSQSGSDIILSWDAASDAETPTAGLTYNLRIGTTPNGEEVKSSHSNPETGFRELVLPGNVQNMTSWAIHGLADGNYYWSVQSIDNAYAGSSFASEQSFAIGDLPSATTQSATDLGASSATLNGLVNPNGFETTVIFEYGLSTDYGQHITATPNPLNGSTETPVSADPTGLSGATEYHFRVVATSSVGSVNGADQVFTTLVDGSLPTATTNSATELTSSSATLNGTVNPGNLSTTLEFEYGLTPSYGDVITLLNPINGTDDVPVSAELTGLLAASQYHFRVVATNSMGSANGQDQVFTTLSDGSLPVVTTGTTTDLTTHSVVLNGSVNPGDQLTSVLFEFGVNSSYGDEFIAVQSPISGSADIQVDASVEGLNEHTKYHYRVVASNASGTSYGEDQEFTTSANYPETFTLDSFTDFPTHENADEYSVTDYRMFGLPGSSSLLASELLNGKHAEDWQVFWDNGNTSDYLVEFDGSSYFQFRVGRAFWVINKGRLEIDGFSPTAPLNSDNQVELPLHSGWNLITNPLMTTISWASIQNLNEISDPIWSFDGSFHQASSFECYQGYYYFNADGLSKLKIPIQSTTLTKSAPGIEDPDQWQATIILATGSQLDRSAHFGVVADASETLDRYDYRKPHAIGTLAGVTFKRPEWDADYPAFAADIRPMNEDYQLWDFELENLTSEMSQLSFDGLDQIPTQYDVYLINIQNGQAIDLRTEPSYDFVASSPGMKFILSVGSAEQVQNYINKMSPETPFIGQNYPNPFNPSTTLSYRLPESSSMSLIIYDVQGNIVSVLKSGSQSAGWYDVVWDGETSDGKQISTGIYFVRLVAGDYSQVIKMLFLK